MFLNKISVILTGDLQYTDLVVSRKLYVTLKITINPSNMFCINIK